MNRFINTIIVEYKKISIYENQMQRIIKKIKNLKIILKKTIVIIIFNNFDFKFEIYLIIVNNKARIEKKLLEFDTLIKVL